MSINVDRRRPVARRTGVIAGIAALALAIAGCAGAGEPEPDPGETETETIESSFVTPFKYSVNFAPVLFADAGGYFADAGIDVRVEGGSGGSAAIQQVLSGNIDFGEVGVLNLMQAISNEAAPLVAIATISQESIFWVISPADAPLGNAEDLVGKTVGLLSLGGPTEVVLDLMLRESEIEPSEVNREVAGGGVASFELMRQGRIDAAIVSAGEVALLESAGNEFHAWNTGQVAAIPGQAYFTTRQFAEQNPQAVEAFLRGVHASVTAMLGSGGLDDALDAIAEEYSAEIPTISNREQSLAELSAMADSWVAGNGGEAGILRSDPEAWKVAVDILTRQGMLTGGVPAEDMYTTEFESAWQ